MEEVLWVNRETAVLSRHITDKILTEIFNQRGHSLNIPTIIDTNHRVNLGMIWSRNLLFTKEVKIKAKNRLM